MVHKIDLIEWDDRAKGKFPLLEELKQLRVVNADLLAACRFAVERVDTIMDFGERSCPFCGHHHIHTDESNIGTGDREYERKVCPYPRLKAIIAKAEAD